jgi:arylsulfatase A-like enzyme
MSSVFRFILLLGLTASAASAAEPRRPNILFILADDMGYGDLGCYGNAGIRTPNIDRLAAEGLRFKQFYVNAPICSPSRAAFMTGQYPARWKITSFLSNRAANTQRGMAQHLAPDAPFLPRILREAGYYTAHVGKWHLGGQRDVGDSPVVASYGFDAVLTQFEGLGDRLLPVYEEKKFPNSGDGRHPLGVASAKHGQGKTEFVPRHAVTGRFVDRAIAEIGAARKAGRPFYVNLWPDDPHTELEPSAENRGDKSTRAMLAGVLRELDRDVGRIIDFIRNDQELRANTLVIFASDNGPEENVGSAGGLRGHKGTLYEGGTRAPFIVWGPGILGREVAGPVNERSVVAAMDFAPSLLALTGVKTPPNITFDGVDASAILTGRSEALRTTPIMWLRPPDRPGPQNSFPDLAVRDGDWKLLLESDGSNPQLYDLSRDPGETLNVAGGNPAVVQRLAAAVRTWQQSLPP